jgi:hypothetical protein
VMTFRAKAYGRALNGQPVSGTLLTAAVAMADGVDPYDGKTVRSEVIYDEPFVAQASVTVGGLSSSKRYRIQVTAGSTASSEWIDLMPDSSASMGWYLFDDGNIYARATMPITFITGGDPNTFIAVATIEPRIDGACSFLCQSSGQNFTTCHAAGGTTTVDYTSLEFVFSAAGARSGRITITEETP